MLTLLLHESGLHLPAKASFCSPHLVMLGKIVSKRACPPSPSSAQPCSCACFAKPSHNLLASLALHSYAHTALASTATLSCKLAKPSQNLHPPLALQSLALAACVDIEARGMLLFPFRPLLLHAIWHMLTCTRGDTICASNPTALC